MKILTFLFGKNFGGEGQNKVGGSCSIEEGNRKENQDGFSPSTIKQGLSE